MTPLTTETFARDKTGALWLNEPLQYLKGSILAPSAEPPSPNLAAGGRSAPIAFESPSDGYSEITDLVGVRGAGDDTEETLYSELIQNSHGSERYLQNRPVIAAHMFGSAQQPFLMAHPFISKGMLTPLLSPALPSRVPGPSGGSRGRPPRRSLARYRGGRAS